MKYDEYNNSKANPNVINNEKSKIKNNLEKGTILTDISKQLEIISNNKNALVANLTKRLNTEQPLTKPANISPQAQGPVYLLKKEALQKREKLLAPPSRKVVHQPSNFKPMKIHANPPDEKTQASSTEPQIIQPINDDLESKPPDLADFIDRFFNRELTGPVSATSMIFSQPSKTTQNITDPIVTSKPDDKRKKTLENVRFSDAKSAQLLEDYLKANEILSNEKLTYFMQRRVNCKCISNRLECCLKTLSILNIKKALRNKSDRDLEEIMAYCCSRCLEYETDFGGVKPDADLSSEYYSYLKNLGLPKLDDILTGAKLLNAYLNMRMQVKCTCEENRYECCLAHIYRLVESDRTDVLPDCFFQSKCCLDCASNQHPTTDQPNSDQFKSVFKQRVESISDNEDEKVAAKPPIEHVTQPDETESATDFVNPLVVEAFLDRLFNKSNLKPREHLPVENRKFKTAAEPIVQKQSIVKKLDTPRKSVQFSEMELKPI